SEVRRAPFRASSVLFVGNKKRGRKASPDPDLRSLGPNCDQVSLLITTRVAARRLHLFKIHFVNLRTLQLAAIIHVDRLPFGEDVQHLRARFAVAFARRLPPQAKVAPSSR